MQGGSHGCLPCMRSCIWCGVVHTVVCHVCHPAFDAGWFKRLSTMYEILHSMRGGWHGCLPCKRSQIWYGVSHGCHVRGPIYDEGWFTQLSTMQEILYPPLLLCNCLNIVHLTATVWWCWHWQLAGVLSPSKWPRYMSSTKIYKQCRVKWRLRCQHLRHTLVKWILNGMSKSKVESWVAIITSNVNILW
jgi:hypothetical protein